MSDQQNYPIATGVDQIQKILCRAVFAGVGVSPTLPLAKGVQGPDVASVTTSAVGVYALNLRQPYPMFIGGRADVSILVASGANVFKASFAIDSQTSVSSATAPKLTICVYNATGALADPPAGAVLLAEACVRNHSQAM